MRVRSKDLAEQRVLPRLRVEEGRAISRYVVTAGWKDSPHLTPQAIEEMARAFPPHELEARMNGTPSLGEGKIFDIDEATFLVADFEIPAHWYRTYGLDVGWNRTACIWLAEDRDSDVTYAYSEHYASESVPAIHAEAIKSRGAIPGVIDPAARGRSQIDGEALMDVYTRLGLDLDAADNSVEAGIYAVRQRLVAGKLKIFKSCSNLLAEYRLYRRDEKGKVVKHRDHACDALRYAIMSGLGRAKQMTPKRQMRSGSRIFSG